MLCLDKLLSLEGLSYTMEKFMGPSSELPTATSMPVLVHVQCTAGHDHLYMLYVANNV
jgi:hypothetical protein